MEITNTHIIGFLSTMKQKPSSERKSLPYLGIDECLNRMEIKKLSSSLWYEFRGREDKFLGAFRGGVSRDSVLREPNPYVEDLGVPVKGKSWSDYQIIQMLIINFIDFDNLVLLTENTRNNEAGVRRILSDTVSPAMKNRNDNLSLTAIYRKGKTDINVYCSEVTHILENIEFSRGYREVLV